MHLYPVVLCLLTAINLGSCGGAPKKTEPKPEDLAIDERIIRSYKSGKAADFIQSNDTLLVELDIILTAQQWLERSQQQTRSKRSGLKSQLWPHATVPYDRIDRNTFSSDDERTILDAFEEYRRYTCIRFRPSTSRDRGRIYFFSGGGCFSALGHQGRRQGVSLADGCRGIGTVIHELGHAVGMHHEQTRPDRDQFITLDETNIDKDMMYNFDRLSTRTVDSRNIPYDYLSIMHYGQDAFAVDRSKPSIITHDSRYQYRIGQSYGLSSEDIELLTLMYGCNSHCGNKRCPSGGFLSKDCTCWCKRNVEFGEPVAMCDTGDRVPGGKPGGGFGKCKDREDKGNCDWWKEQGYCKNKFVSFMMDKCRDTCGWCFEDQETTGGTQGGGTGGAGGDCENEHPSCDDWASAGFCTNSQHMPYMTRACKKSCNLCIRGYAAVCEDISPHCADFKSQGDCDNNPHWMSIYCKRTCNACMQSFRARICRDANENCQAWVDRGMCEQNREYMHSNCAKSCKFCTDRYH